MIFYNYENCSSFVSVKLLNFITNLQRITQQQTEPRESIRPRNKRRGNRCPPFIRRSDALCLLPPPYNWIKNELTVSPNTTPDSRVICFNVLMELFKRLGDINEGFFRGLYKIKVFVLYSSQRL